MLLAIDAGNSNIKFALFSAEQTLVARWRIATDARRTADQYAPWLTQLFELQGIERNAVRLVAISCVVPRALHNLETLSRQLFGVEPLIAGRAPLLWDVGLDVADPTSVGADRVCNAIGAQALAAGDKIVVSFGTATTIDHVDGQGTYRGGLIAPGVNLSIDALVDAAAKLPRVAIERPDGDTIRGRSTEAQMRIGLYWGWVAMLEGLLSRMKTEIGAPPRTIATGGLAYLFDAERRLFDEVEPNLTLSGLATLVYRSGGRA